MTLSELKIYIETILNKHSSGNTLSPTEFNNLLKANIYTFVRTQVTEYRQYLKSGIKTDAVLATAMLIDALQKQATGISLVSGAFTITSAAADFLMMDSLWGTLGGTTREIEIVSPEEYGRRLHNLMLKPVAYFPVAYVVGTSCKVNPTNVTAIVMNYIAKPTTPIYDYYSDANYNIVYLAASATHLLTSGEVGSAGQTAGSTVTSLTVETDLPEDLHAKFGDYLISKVAVRDRDVNLYQANENEIAKDK